jgi:HEPN domain-containing protein
MAGLALKEGMYFHAQQAVEKVLKGVITYQEARLL